MSDLWLAKYMIEDLPDYIILCVDDGDYDHIDNLIIDTVNNYEGDTESDRLWLFELEKATYGIRRRLRYREDLVCWNSIVREKYCD